MPFDQYLPRSFTVPAIREHAPALSGVYGISNAREWIYIGETDNIQQMLMEHVRESNTALLKRQPTGFVFEVCAPARRADRQDRLVFEYAPVCNRPSEWHP
jgi:hypothetical protein